MTQQVREKERQQEELRKDLQDKNNQVEKLTVQLQEKDSEVEERKQRLRDKEGELEERDQRLERLESEVGGETPDTDSPRPQDEGSTVVPGVRRRRSMDYPPEMGGESSSPDPPVSPSVSELRLVLLGRTGAGRRAAGNTILGREEFGAQDSPSAVAQRSRRREGDVCGRRLVLVDTPDWFCPGLCLEEMRQDVGLCVRLSAPGPHAFLLVVPVEPSEGEERGAMERMEDMFGEGCWGHTVILFTHDDSLREQSMEEFLQTGSQDLQQLVEKCGNRYHVLNMKDRAHGTQVPELLHLVEEMVAGNRESFYSSQTYQGAEAQVREMEGKIQREREEKIQREETERKEKFETELQNSLKKIEGVIQEHEGDIRTLSHRTSELERQRSIMISHTKMQRNFSRQMQEKDRQIQEKAREMEVKDIEIEKLMQRLMDLSGQFIEEVNEISEWKSPQT
ncbi:GTPase IMAP family member 4-like [Osmerus mordax]|uniref:GTPase IMAP family member 4-like n=1 Tax=Osmerus mordax TaxID=8014 RepID=UPI00350EC6D6